MKQFIIATTGLFIFSITSLFGEGYHFEIQQHDHKFASYFDIDSDDTYPGTVKKSVFRLRENYDLSDEHGWQATGIVRAVSLGTVYPWAKEVDIFDTQYEWIGFIQGQVLTTAAARYNIYNQSEQLVGLVYLNSEMASFSIVDPENPAHRIAQFKRIYVEGIKDPWRVIVYDGDAIDERMLRLFAAIMVDIQEQFLK